MSSIELIISNSLQSVTQYYCSISTMCNPMIIDCIEVKLSRNATRASKSGELYV